MYVEKVSIDIVTGVVAQKYTHSASKYFLFFKFTTSGFRKPKNYQYITKIKMQM